MLWSRELKVQKSLRGRPAIAHGSGRDSQRPSRLFFCHSAKEPALHDATELRVDVRESGQGVVQLDERLRAFVHCEMGGIQRHATLLAAAFDRSVPARMINEYSTHRNGGEREEVGSVPPSTIVFGKAEERLVNEARGVERMPRWFDHQPKVGESLQLVVHEWKQAIQVLLIC